MKINSTELQNNFGKYLMLAPQEEIIITRNGTPIAKLTSIQEHAKYNIVQSDRVKEQAFSSKYYGQKASYKDFVELTTDSEERYEYIDGEIFLLASPKTTHQRVLADLFAQFYHWFQGKSCTPMIAPYDITLKKADDQINVVQPDLMVICDLEEKLDAQDYYQGVPSLIVEVISESTRSKDMIKKLELYMSCGVEEYWIVNPMNKEISIYLFEEQNIAKNKTYKENEIVQSFLYEGLDIRVNHIF